MKILDNGFHSFKNAINLLQYLEKPKDQNYEYTLKEIIISLHHSVETLFKYIIKSTNEYLLYENINDIFSQKSKNFIENKNNDIKYQTIKFIDAIDRVIILKNEKMSSKQYNFFITLNEYRNALTHFELETENKQIEHLIANVLPIIYRILKNNIPQFKEFAKNNNLQANVNSIIKEELNWKLKQHINLIKKIQNVDTQIKYYDSNPKEKEKFFKNHNTKEKNINYEKCPYCNKNTFIKTNTIIIGFEEKIFSGECKFCGFKSNKENALFIFNDFSNYELYLNDCFTYIFDILEEIICNEDNLDKTLELEEIKVLGQLYESNKEKMEDVFIQIVQKKVEELCEYFAESYFDKHVNGYVEYGEEMLNEGSVSIDLSLEDLECDNELVNIINNIYVFTNGNLEFLDGKVQYSNEFEYSIIYPNPNWDNEDTEGPCYIQADYKFDSSNFWGVFDFEPYEISDDEEDV